MLFQRLGIATTAFVVALCAPQLMGQTRANQPLQIGLDVVSQRYCEGRGSTYDSGSNGLVTFAQTFMEISLRVTYVNASGKTLILDRGIGKRFFDYRIAGTLEDLNAGKYEGDAIDFDWTFKKADKPPDPRAPDSDFVVLRPKERFLTSTDISLLRPLPYGEHVLRLDLGAWTHLGDESDYERSWRRVGQLITGTLQSQPVQVTVSANPPTEKCQ